MTVEVADRVQVVGVDVAQLALSQRSTSVPGSVSSSTASGNSRTLSWPKLLAAQASYCATFSARAASSTSTTSHLRPYSSILTVLSSRVSSSGSESSGQRIVSLSPLWLGRPNVAWPA